MFPTEDCVAELMISLQFSEEPRTDGLFYMFLMICLILCGFKVKFIVLLSTLLQWPLRHPPLTWRTETRALVQDRLGRIIRREHFSNNGPRTMSMLVQRKAKTRSEDQSCGWSPFGVNAILTGYYLPHFYVILYLTDLWTIEMGAGNWCELRCGICRFLVSGTDSRALMWWHRCLWRRE